MTTSAWCSPLSCPALVDGPWESPEQVAGVFRDALELRMGQAWLPGPSPRFAPGRVRVGWTPQELLFLAELADGDIFNPETGFNQFFFQRGDVFEIFVRALPAEPYYEFHVGPDNQHFQLRLPHANPWAGVKKGEPSPDFTVKDPAFFASRVWVRQHENRWFVAVRVPFANIGGPDWAVAGAELLLSCSRYDYTRNEEKPVHSSTSPHPTLNFHRQEEWARLRLA
jgi:hypothetical protein